MLGVVDSRKDSTYLIHPLWKELSNGYARAPLFEDFMNKRETAIISAYTGVSFGGDLFSEFHKYVEDKFGHSVWVHEMSSEQFWIKLKELAKDDFMQLARNITE